MKADRDGLPRHFPGSSPLPVAFFVFPAACAADPALGYAGLETDFASKYTWRGTLAYSTGAVAHSLMDGLPFTGSHSRVWGDAVLGKERKSGNFDGGDVAVGWSRDFGRWRIEPGFEFWFDRPVNAVFDPATGEFSARVSLPGRISCASS